MLHDLVLALPIGIVALMGCFVLLLDAFQDRGDSRYIGYISAGGMAAALAVIYVQWGTDVTGFTSATFGDMMVLGRFEMATCALLLVIGASVCLMSVEHAREQGFDHGELYALIHFALFGMMTLVCATNAVTLFVGLEIMSIAVYALAAIKRSSPFAAESGMKYFILGAFASGFLLMGLAYLYGETVSLEYAGIFAALHGGEPSGFVTMAVVLLVTAFGFKIALVPFHMWTPDVYEGAPPPITGLMATGVKTAGVIAMGRIFVMALPPSALGAMAPHLFDTLAALAIVTMCVGNLIALHQTNVKRMLGYSSVAHAGYLLIGILAAHVAAGPDNADWGTGMGSVLFYLVTYALANLAIFAVIGTLVRGDEENVDLNRVSGLAKEHPVAGVVLAIGLLSLAGMPPTAGFFGKLVLFREALAVDTDRFMWLVIIAVLNSVVSVYYYLRVIVHAYMKPSIGSIPMLRGAALTMAFVITALGTLHVGVFPGRTLKATTAAAQSFIPVAHRDLATPLRMAEEPAAGDVLSAAE